jgi:RNA polymerase sigma-70 factor (ECF subfamily)
VAWVTVAAVRTGLSLLREQKRADKYAGDAWAEILALPDTGDMEVEYLKGRYRQDFAAGFTDACAKLPARDRTILRMHFVDGLNIDQIGQIYGVHRATVARWIAKSRLALLEGTRTYLVQHLALQPAEFSSFDRLIRSQLDVSLGGLFGSEDALDPE